MGIKVKELDAIIFDLGGVIYNLDYDLTINAFKTLGENRFDELYSQAMQNNVFDQFEMGLMSTKDFIHYLMNFLPKVNQERIVVDAWNKMLLEIPSYRIDFIKDLKSHTPVFLLSNTNDIHYQVVQSHLKENFGDAQLLDKLFEKAYFSHLIHKRKPNADVFEQVIDENQLNPAKTLFIDDSIQHIEGADKVGLQTYHLVDEDIIDIFDRSNP